MKLARKRCFRHPARPEAALWAATRGELLFLANHEAALQACLDVADGRRSALAGSPALKKRGSSWTANGLGFLPSSIRPA